VVALVVEPEGQSHEEVEVELYLLGVVVEEEHEAEEGAAPAHEAWEILEATRHIDHRHNP
jgi:hypothetical protein